MNRHLTATYSKYNIDTSQEQLTDIDIQNIFTCISGGHLNWEHEGLRNQLLSVRRDFPSGRYLQTFFSKTINCSAPIVSPSFWTARGFDDTIADTRAQQYQMSRKRPLTISYWTELGFSKTDAKNCVSQEQSSRSQKAYRARDKAYRLKKTPRSEYYWTSRGYNVEHARRAIRDIGEKHSKTMKGRPNWLPTHKRNTNIAFYEALGMTPDEAIHALRTRQRTRYTSDETRRAWNEYYCECWWHTRQHLSEVPDIEKRSSTYHLDHRYSIYDGFHTQIDPCIIGSSINLRIIPASDNCRKQRKSDITKEELLHAYHTVQH